ncbi:hypothetical protein GCL60_13140 [Silvanigrella paludirubra]|uniref:TolC family protein n=1 Tax=Silvanigrella paludirubra TaxID=2499159 RepID=A0A6N6VNL8_9BACT|nr:TolC family protein [Silvanigrella paludirubra]KAB8036783.1 hypothetical protein GCL60_13140 [Silvanigrella paludirubra]
MASYKNPKKIFILFLKINFIKTLIILFNLISNFNAFGQESLNFKTTKENSMIKIDIENAMKMTQNQSDNLKASQANLSSTEYEEKATARGLLPNLSATSNITWNEGNSDSESFTFPQNAPSSSSNATLTLTQPILGVIPIFHQLNQKEITTKINKLLVSQTKIQSALLGATYFLNAQLASQQLSIANATIETVKKSKSDAEVLYQTGSIYKDDYLRILLQYSQTTQEVNNAKSQLDIALFSLSQAIGVSNFNQIQLVSNEKSSWEIKNPKIPSLEDAKKIALKNNQSILIAKENIKYAEVTKTLNLDNYLPSINAFISYTKNINPSSSTNSSNSLSSSDNYVSYGLQMSWNLWDWGIRNNQDNSLNEKVVAQKYLEKNQKEQILNQVFQNYSTIQNNISSVSLAKDAAQTAEEAYKLVSYRFLNGQVAALDLVTSQQSLTTAKASLAQARFNLDLAWLTFQATLGLYPSLSKLD